LIVFSAEHLRRILANYASYYNAVRTIAGNDTPTIFEASMISDEISEAVSNTENFAR
jgi:hypothetical protein